MSAEAAVTPATGSRFRFGGIWPIVTILAALLVVIAFRQPDFYDPPVLLAFMKRAAPLVILAAGQYFVIAAGDFDLSVGSLVTAEVVIAARLIDGDPSLTWPVIGVMVGFGLLVGLVNGVVTTLLHVPSFITTLGMYLILVGAVYTWTGGSPRGALSEEFRLIGRKGIEGIPVLGQLPYAVLVLIGVAVLVIVTMRSDFGRILLAVGDNPRAAALSGVRTARVRTIAFLFSGALAAVAAILLGGFGGVSFQVGAGLEFTAITAVVLGGVVLGGGRGSVTGAMLGALTLETLFTLLNLLGVSGALKSAVQGLIIIAAVAIGTLRRR
ncbi:ribose transport system permease protein [Allocatelliglobosispora scoriae]|uniref:Ribose transport system permease protein n=1 Tax=Allocatelliglobosispora scoriae TaxID=643052 RepID=A0A841BKI4_9ACTN|nr:ABC transporter permease [Allocatelliglobosispora scoriae]MBB5867699.1 ribose transport system permease protein [Allocatelliglobosispora scoriae]